MLSESPRFLPVLLERPLPDSKASERGFADTWNVKENAAGEKDAPVKEKEGLLELARGFQTSRVVLTAAELDLFTRLDESTATPDELARELDLDTRAATRLLDCLVTLGLLSKKDGRYHNTGEGSLGSSRHAETVRPLLLHMSHLWHNWSQLTESVREGTNPRRRRVTEQGSETLKSFIGAMHAIGRPLSREIAEFYDLGRFHTLLDIGGGSGTYTISFLEQNPHLRAMLFDLPDVIAMARNRLEEQGLLNRVTLVAGDFYDDALPPGSDVALLSAIIHQNSKDQNAGLFRKIHRALLPGGVLLIRDYLMDEERTYPPPGALFALNMLVATEGGDTYTFPEVETLLIDAGFDDVRCFHQGEGMDSLVEARKPG